MTQVVFKRAANLAEMKAQAIEIAASYDGKVWAEAGIYTDDNGMTQRPQVVLCTGDWEEIAVLRWNAMSQEEGSSFLGKRNRSQARESAERFQDIVQDVITRHYESTSPVEVVNEYTAIKAESVANEVAATLDYYVILSANIVVAGCSTLELAAQRMNVMSHDDGHVTAIHFTGLTHEQRETLAGDTLARKNSKQMTGRKFAKASGLAHSFKSRSQLNSEWEAQEASEWLSDSPAPEGWTEVEGGAYTAEEHAEIAAALDSNIAESASAELRNSAIAKLTDAMATRCYMYANELIDQPKAFKAVENALSLALSSIEQAQRMSAFATLTTASHGPMIDGQIDILTRALGDLLAIRFEMDAE